MEDSDKRYSEEEIKELLREALQMQLSSVDRSKKIKSIESAISSTLGEFLDSYIIIGYDPKGDPFIMRHGSTQLQKNALQTLAMRFLSYLMYDEG